MSTPTSNRLLRPFSTALRPAVSRELDALQANIRRMFDHPLAANALAAEALAAPFGTPIGWLPPVEIVETPEALVLTAELPGMTLEQIALTLDGDVLTLKGEKGERAENEQEEDGRKYHVFERSYGTFVRAFTLPRAVDPSKVVANFADGVLTVTLPKLPEAAVKGTVIPIAATAPPPTLKAPVPPKAEVTPEAEVPPPVAAP